jgi:hypothetical protein
VTTPDESEGHAPLKVVRGTGKGGGKPPTSQGSVRNNQQQTLEFDSEWIGEHACQLARILPGGLSVLGVYVFCELNAFQASQTVLSGLLKQIESEMVHAKPGSASLVVHVDASRGICSAKEKDGVTLKPCDAKNSSLMTEMVELRCTFPLNMRVDVCHEKEAMSDLVNDLISMYEEQRVLPAVALLQGKIPGSMDDALSLAKREGLDHIPVDMLLPYSMDCCPSLQATKVQGSSGTFVSKGAFVLKGNMECRAYVSRREGFDDAIVALKEDAGLSLRHRLDILVEAAEMATDAMEQKGATKEAPPTLGSKKHPLLDTIVHVGSYKPQFPRRAFLKWKQCSCCFCDYIVEGDGVHEALHRIRELVGPGKVDATTFHCNETSIENRDTPRKERMKKSKDLLAFVSSPCNIMVAGTVAFAGLAIILASSFGA